MPERRIIPVLIVMLAFCVVGMTQAGDRSEVASEREGRSVPRDLAGARDAPVSIHRLLLDRMDLMLRTARALQAADDEPIRGNGLSDGPDPTDSQARSEYDEDEESKSDGDRTGEYQDAVDESSTGEHQSHNMTMG